ncbi:MAG: LysM domain-containing protein [Rhodanobacter sp.]
MASPRKHAKRMAPGLPRIFQHHRQIRLLLVLPLVAMLGVAGCAQVNKLKARVGDQMGSHPTQPASPVAAAEAGYSNSFSLATIVNEQLQHGRYTEGEKALRRYLSQHPGDRPAQAVLRQLTADPDKMLGHASRSYVVQADDSYSSLAARYLGDAGLFLILARYNHSDNPSVLRKGETVRLPLTAGKPAPPPETPARVASNIQGAELKLTEAPPGDSAPVTSNEPQTAKAKRLQQESVILLGQGHKQQALARLDEALLVNPRLQPSRPELASLRQELVVAYHQRAIVLYRNQQLDAAIGLWDHVLAIDPGYEPAQVYRTRARELKQRLKQY